MAAVDRASIRKAVAAMLESVAVGEGKPAQALYAYQASDIGGQSPVIMVLSAGSRRRRHPSGVDSFNNDFRLAVLIFTADADLAAGWTDEMVEDRIDLLEKTIADAVAAYRTYSLWKFLDFEDEFSAVVPAMVGGKPYKMEQIFLIGTVY